MFKEKGLFVLGMIFPFIFTKLPAPYSVICFIAIPLCLIFFLWKNLKSFALGLISAEILIGILLSVALIGDWIVMRQFPDGEKLLLALEEYKSAKGVYPDDLDTIGFTVDKHRVSYYSKKTSFCICYDIFGDGGCYDSRIGKSSPSCFSPPLH